ncbi:MAG: SDR family NAD(P)-dependent oxidoreductase [Oscillospiraceae bacterium]|nr:SDR family NAD(P)-dependent oxidoreductase [Oscillospiraceae bacterium]
MNVFITGASGGLGRAIAAECASRGYRLFLTDINDTGLHSLQRGLECQYGACVTTRACDLTSDESVDEMLAVIDDNGIRFDMLFNIAGIDYEGGFLERERGSVVKIVSLNVEATLRITHAVLARRREGKQFSLVFVSSLASLYPMPLKATYAASKRFLTDFSEALRHELKSRNVRVLTLCPGGLPTTEEAISGIAAQGFWGSVTTNRLERVAFETVEKARKGQGLYIPGAANRAMSFLGKILPRSVVAAIIYKRWSGAQKKWLCDGSE